MQNNESLQKIEGEASEEVEGEVVGGAGGETGAAVGGGARGGAGEKVEAEAKAQKRHKLVIWCVNAAIVAMIIVVAVAILVMRSASQFEPEEEMLVPSGEFIDTGTLDSLIDGKTTYVFTSYQDYLAKTAGIMDDRTLTAEDFVNDNYAIILFEDRCSIYDIAPVGMTRHGDVIDVEVKTWEGGCQECPLTYRSFMFKIDKSIRNPEINVETELVKYVPCENNQIVPAEKPMIYLYPEETTEVEVRLGKPEKLIVSYPKYDDDDGWRAVAEPDGMLRAAGSAAAREFYGLYWEGDENEATVREDGFVVAGEDAAEFLEEKLAILGLTEREANEFIVYWLPRLEANPYNYVRFETREEIDAYMPLEVTPQPDSVIRIIMDFKALEKPVEVVGQELATPERNGFTVVEWGGAEIR